jgi:menaquinol-cytochrome c reductase iron-sulfur subunit
LGGASPTNRRSALKVIGLALLAACDATVARLKGKKLVDVAALAQVPRDSVYRTTHDDQPLIVVNDGGTIRTFLAVCTHEGCPLGWNPNQHLIRCPCHGSAFDVSGHVVNGPATRPLTQLETFIERGRVLVSNSVGS